MSLNHLPSEIVIEILSRLPVKTLITLRQVCKSLYFLISDPSFITAHLNRSVSNGNGFILYMPKHRTSTRRCTILCTNKFNEHSVELQLDDDPESCTIVGSLNGVLCLTNTFGRRSIYICNPSIRVFKTIRCPCPSRTSLDSSSLVILGFGYHREKTDYKVVRIPFSHQNRYEDMILKEDPPHPGEGSEVEVYSLRNSSWKTMSVHFPWTMIDVSSVKFVNGCIHWMAANAEQEIIELVLAFDVGNEAFREIMLPNYRADITEDIELDLSVGVLKESLALFVYPCESNVGVGRCYLWEMREYGVVESWTKRITVEIEGIHMPLSFTMFEEILLEENDGTLCLADFKNHMLKYLGIRRTTRVEFVPFMESLALLGESSRITHKKKQPPGKWDKGSTSTGEDRFSKYATFVPASRDCTAEEAARLFFKNVVKYWGLPQNIISDRDPRFTGKLWTELFKFLGTELCFSTSFHPQTDGQTERVNALLELYLRHFVAANQKDWAQLLDVAQLSYNLQRSEATHKSPFEIVTGQQPLTPHTIAVNDGTSPGAARMVTSWKQQADMARAYLDKAAKRMKKFADRKRRPAEYRVGDMVMMKLLPQQFKVFRKVHKGLIRKYEGPFAVVAKVGKVSYKLDLPSELKIHPVFHVSMLKPYYGDKDDLERCISKRAPPAVTISYEKDIDSILGHKMVRLRSAQPGVQFLVKWKGLPESEATWENAEDLWQFKIEMRRYVEQATGTSPD